MSAEQLISASKRGDLARVKELVKKFGVDVNAPDSENGDTALLWACLGNNTDLTVFLADHPRIDLNYRNKVGNTALIHTTYKTNRLPMLRHLLSKPNIQVNGQSREHHRKGQTALHVASGYGHTEMVQLLLDFPGIQMFLKDEDGKTPLDRATANGHSHIVSLLVLHDNKEKVVSRVVSSKLDECLEKIDAFQSRLVSLEKKLVEMENAFSSPVPNLNVGNDDVQVLSNVQVLTAWIKASQAVLLNMNENLSKGWGPSDVKKKSDLSMAETTTTTGVEPSFSELPTTSYHTSVG